MTQAILSFYPFNVLTQPYKRTTRKSLHAYVAALATLTALSGIIIEYIGRSQSSKPHFSTTHSTIGLIAAIFTFIGGVNGTATYYSVELRSFVKPLYLKFVHNLNGIVSLTLGNLMIILQMFLVFLFCSSILNGILSFVCRINRIISWL